MRQIKNDFLNRRIKVEVKGISCIVHITSCSIILNNNQNVENTVSFKVISEPSQTGNNIFSVISQKIHTHNVFTNLGGEPIELVNQP